MIRKETDIVIVGGGLIGASLLLALKNLGYSCLLVDKNALEISTELEFDTRSLALAPSSQKILQVLKVWDLIREHATPIKTIHVSEQGRFGVTRFQSTENPLGHVVELHILSKALKQLLPSENFITATLESLNLNTRKLLFKNKKNQYEISARFIIAADGSFSKVRELLHSNVTIKDYKQWALVANIGLKKSHDGQAFERFTKLGPLALLPMQHHRMSLIWAVPEHEATRFLQLDEKEFLRVLQAHFGYRLGAFQKVGRRSTYHLQQFIMPEQIKDSLVFLGNAAHTLHPIAGQGFNLGLRDIATLAQCFSEKGLTTNALEFYLQMRSSDHAAIRRFTDGLVNIFSSKLPGVGAMRGIGLTMLDNFPWAKNNLARYARGFGGNIPDLVCEIALEGQHEV